MRLSALAVLALLCAGTVPARERSGELPAASPEIRYVGRTETTGGSVSFDWSGTYFECRFTGGSLAVRVSDTKRNYYNLTLDGHDAGIVATFGTDSLVVLTEGLGEGEHTLRMQKRTEGEQGRTTLHAFRLARNGRLLPAPPSPGRHIEFIGNSLTCGYGTEGRSKDEPFEPETENCDKAFGCIVARYFGADYTLIAHSGRGAARNYGDRNTVSENTMADRLDIGLGRRRTAAPKAQQTCAVASRIRIDQACAARRAPSATQRLDLLRDLPRQVVVAPEPHQHRPGRTLRRGTAGILPDAGDQRQSRQKEQNRPYHFTAFRCNHISSSSTRGSLSTTRLSRSSR